MKVPGRQLVLKFVGQHSPLLCSTLTYAGTALQVHWYVAHIAVGHNKRNFTRTKEDCM